MSSDFRALAGSYTPLLQGCHLLLEPFPGYWFRTFNYPSYYSAGTKTSYDLCVEVGRSLGLSAPLWSGVNGALSLRRGFRNALSRITTPWSNPSCGRMTYSSRHNSKGNHRMLFDIRDSSGGYTRIAKLHIRIFRDFGRDTACDSCDRTEGLVRQQQFYGLQPKIDMLLCRACTTTYRTTHVDLLEQVVADTRVRGKDKFVLNIVRYMIQCINNSVQENNATWLSTSSRSTSPSAPAPP